MDPIREHLDLMTRRHFFGRNAAALGGAALASLMAPRPAAADASEFGGLPGLPHFAPKAKRAIYLHMNGGPSQIDLLDYKPTLADWFDKDLPESVRNGQRLTTMTSGQKRFPLAPSKFKFAQHGQCGTWV